jgi:hypothetical protein
MPLGFWYNCGMTKGGRATPASRRRRAPGATTSKRTISFDATVLAAAERLAQSESAGNLSALVNDAVAHHVRLRAFGEFLDELDRELGPVPAEVVAAVEREWRD